MNGLFMKFPNKPIKFNSKSSSKNYKTKNNSKYDIKKYKILNSFINRNIKFKFKKPKEKKEYNTLNTTPPKSKEILFSKNDMPYIPSKERQKGEANFIQLIKILMNSKQKNSNKSNNKQNILFNKNTSIEDPYKPKGYNYYRYSREHPDLIYDNKTYIKTIQESYNEKGNQEKKFNERCLSYSNIEYNYDDDKYNNKISLNKLNNIKLDNNIETNNVKVMPTSKSCTRYAYTINDNNILNSNNNFNSFSDRINIKTNDNNKDNKNDSNNEIMNSLPIINSTEIRNSFQNYKINKINKKKYLTKKDYRQSDIFNLKKNSYSENYLFNNNCISLKNYVDRKTSINEVGWSPRISNNISRISVSSVAFNILSPDLKNISPMKKDIDLLNNNNNYKSNLMSEFVDMCKPGDTELRKEYKDKLNANRNIFHRNNYCSAYNDMHHGYKDLILDAF
jgi:hypothetical protein